MIKPKPPGSILRVLLVEDSLVNQRVVIGLLNGMSCEVSTAPNGEVGVDMLLAEEFDVVLMDVQMPLMDGLTATRVIRQREIGTENRTPIIAVTAGTDRTSCLDAGMDDYLEKPIRRDLLQLALERVLKDSRFSFPADAV